MLLCYQLHHSFCSLIYPKPPNKHNAGRWNCTGEKMKIPKWRQHVQRQQVMQTPGKTLQFCQCSSSLTGDNNKIFHWLGSLLQTWWFCHDLEKLRNKVKYTEQPNINSQYIIQGFLPKFVMFTLKYSYFQYVQFHSIIFFRNDCL